MQKRNAPGIPSVLVAALIVFAAAAPVFWSPDRPADFERFRLYGCVALSAIAGFTWQGTGWTDGGRRLAKFAFFGGLAFELLFLVVGAFVRPDRAIGALGREVIHVASVILPFLVGQALSRRLSL